MLDNIEANLEDANDYMEKAENHLKNAKDLHEKNRSKMCCVLFVLFFVILALFWWLFSG